MRPIARGFAVVAMTALLAACGGGGATTAPTTAAGTTPPASTGAGEDPVCAPSTATATTTLSVEGNVWIPNAINAKVGDVIAWTNGDGVPHGVELDDSGDKCTETIGGGGGTAATSFTVAGTYPFHCFVHPSMKGTFTISA